MPDDFEPKRVADRSSLATYEVHDYPSLFSGGADYPLSELRARLTRERRWLLWPPLLFAFVAAVVTVLLPRQFRVQVSFTPQTQASSASRFAGIAASLGVGLPGTLAGESVDFYSDLLKSPELLRATVLTTYPAASVSAGKGATLVQLYAVGGRTRAESLFKATKELENHVGISTSLKSNIVELEVKGQTPQLAEQIARRMLDLVNEFNMRRRQSRAAAEREFVGERLSDARAALTQAEGQLQSFLEKNRVYQSSPQLTFESTRLQRQVDLAQQVYTSLSQAYADASMEQLRNTPVITVIDQPEGTAVPASRGLVRNILAALFVGGALGVVMALYRGRQFSGGRVATAQR